MGYSYKVRRNNLSSNVVVQLECNPARVQALNQDAKMFGQRPISSNQEPRFILKPDEQVNMYINDGFSSLNNRRYRRHTASETNSNSEDSPPSERPSWLENAPELIKNHRELHRYYIMRTLLFSRYEQGIQLDYDRCRCRTILDGFCGAGGNAIQFAFTCQNVIAIDIDPKKIELAKHNASIYGVKNRITFICGDFFKVAPTIKADVVFLSPPWGGPNYDQQGKSFPLEDIMPRDGRELFRVAQNISKIIAYYLPRNVNIYDVIELCGPGKAVEIEQNIMKNKVRAVTCYYDELARTDFISNEDFISESFEYDDIVPSGTTNIKLQSL